ncbi:MAG: DMT family transporter [Lentisphaerales bacterium]|nr:DMT family transporter [Lentisphaerales bacterium]
MYHLMFVYISAIWGSSFILMKWAELCYPAMSLATYRLFGAAVILFVFRQFSKSREKLAKKDLLPLCVMAFCTILPYAVQPFLIAKYGSAFIGMMVIFVPLLTILVSIPLLKVFPSQKQLIGVFGGLFFSWLIVQDGGDRDVTLVDMLLAFSIPFFYALGNTYTKKKLSHMKSLDLSYWIMLISFILLWPFATYLEDIVIDDHFAKATTYLGILGILGTGIPIIFFFYLINNRGPLYAGMVTYVIPIGALIWGAVDGEEITGIQLAAVTGLLLMVAMVQWPEKKTE